MKVNAYLYDARGQDEKISLDSVDGKQLSKEKLLWVDILTRDKEILDEVASKLDLQNVPTSSVASKEARPTIENFDGYFRFSIRSVANAEDASSPEAIDIDYLVGSNFVVTIHDGEVNYFNEFLKREKGDTQLGKLNSESFVASLLDLHIVSYLRGVDAIIKRVDKLDADVLKTEMDTNKFLSEMVRLRSDVSKLRRWLVPHRDVIYSFTRADFHRINETDSLDHFKLLSSHFEYAVDEVESSRDTVISVFDLYATKSAQLMNNFIQRLTFLTLVVGTLSVIAGVLGMNYKVGFFESDYGFWITLVGMVFVAAGLTLFARSRRWI